MAAWGGRLVARRTSKLRISLPTAQPLGTTLYCVLVVRRGRHHGLEREHHRERGKAVRAYKLECAAHGARCTRSDAKGKQPAKTQSRSQVRIAYVLTPPY